MVEFINSMIEVAIYGPIVYTIIGLVFYFGSKRYQIVSFQNVYSQWKSSMKAFVLTNIPGALCHYYFLNGKIGYYTTNEMGLMRNYIYFIFYLLCMDALFYWLHRLMHTPWLYRNFHSYHHQYKEDVTGMATTAFDAIDMFLSGILPVWIPMLFIPTSHISYMIIAMFTNIYGIYLHNAHTTRIPFIFDSTNHYIHHTISSKSNFGLFTKFWDILFESYCHDRKSGP